MLKRFVRDLYAQLPVLLRAFVLGALVTGVLGVLGVTGCAPDEFIKQKYAGSANSIGYRYLPAKVDIVIVPDNTPSINMAFNTVQSQISNFVNSLQGNYWDYHVARSEMLNPSPITSVLVDPIFNSPFLADGTPKPPGGLVPSDRAVTNPASFQILNNTQNGGGGDYTYSNTYNNLLAAKQDQYTNFMRTDALLAIIVVTNGAEYSVDPNHNGSINNGALNTHANNFMSLKDGTNKFVRFYPIAAYGYHSGSGADYCLSQGGSSWIGQSYFSMNNFIKGLPQYQNGTELLNFCNQTSLQNVLSAISADLNAIRQAYVYSNIVLGDAPVPGSIQVFKNGTELTESKSNGWEYKGKGTVYTISGIQDPITKTITPLNPGISQQTGYVIQLNGSAQMVGSDVPNVIYEKQ